MFCRFENRITHTALELSNLEQKLYAYSAADLPKIWQQIQTAQQTQPWTAPKQPTT